MILGSWVTGSITKLRPKKFRRHGHRRLCLNGRQGKSRVSDHLIRLRGAWELTDAAADADAAAEASSNLPIRLTLPVAWPGGSARRVRLVRKFGRLIHDPVHESLLLALDCVPGLRGVWLNGLRQTITDPARGRLEIPIDRLAERNRAGSRRGTADASNGRFQVAAFLGRNRLGGQARAKPLARARPLAWKSGLVTMNFGCLMACCWRCSLPGTLPRMLDLDREQLRKTYQLCRTGFVFLAIALVPTCIWGSC